MKMLLTFLFLTAVVQAQDLSNPELDYYREAPINEDEYNSRELEQIQKQEEESPYFEEYEEDDFVDDEKELQKLEEEYAE
jgi:hypothetical protein